MMSPLRFAFCVLLCGLGTRISRGGSTDLEALRTSPYVRPAVYRSFGVRQAWAESENKVALELGCSTTDTAKEFGAYRIISYDDERYAYEKFVRPLEATAKSVVETRAPQGAFSEAFKSTLVVLTVPYPMQAGARYYVVAQGLDAALITAARSASGFVYKPGQKGRKDRHELDEAVLGLRRISPLNSKTLMLDLGPAFSPKKGINPESITVRVNGEEVPVARTGLRTIIDAYIPQGWPFTAIPGHEVFVELERPYSDGAVLEVSLDPSVCGGARSLVLNFDERSVFSPAIKINQLGYVPDAPVKRAYLGRWMGSFPERVRKQANTTQSNGGSDAFWSALGAKAEESSEATGASNEGGSGLWFSTPPEFYVCDAKTHERVYTGTSRLAHRSGVKDEGVHPVDHSGENVYHLDFSTFAEPGTYYIRVPGVGRSPDFSIAADIYKKAFEVQAYGVMAQRCGMELKPPFSPWHRIACHTNGVIPTTLSRSKGEHDAFTELPNNVDWSLAESVATDPRIKALNRDPALLAYWPLDGNLLDASGHQHHLKPAPEAAVRFEEERMLNAGANKVLGPTGPVSGYFTDELPIDVDSGCTYALWVRLPGEIRFEGTVMGHNPDLFNQPRLRISAGWGVIRSDVGIRSDAQDIGRLSDGKWHHLSMVVGDADSDPQHRVKLYVDGELRASGETREGTDGGTFWLAALTNIGAAGKYYDDVRVYDRPLSQDELNLLAVRWGERNLALPILGGHHDAGDYNPRSHLDVAQELMDTYEMAPEKFYDGQLNMPEAGNGIPDILDEADWALRIWKGLQEADGAVRAGTESNGDPNFLQTVELDTKGDYAFAPDAQASYEFAGAFAQAARIRSSLGRDDEAADLLARAERAWAWAVAHPPKLTDPVEYAKQWLSPRAYAAAHLYHTTGKELYHDAFKDSAVWARMPEAAVENYQLYDQRRAAWAYAQMPADQADPALQEAAQTAILHRADEFIRYNKEMGYSFTRNPWAPITWGTGGYENWLWPIIRAWKLTGDSRYYDWMIRTCDNTLGANPLGICYITGLGARPVLAPLHNSRYSHFGAVVPGMQVQGPNQRGEGYRVQEVFYPRIQEDFANLYTFADVHFAIAMDEGTIANQVRSMAAFGLLLPDAEAEQEIE